MTRRYKKFKVKSWTLPLGSISYGEEVANMGKLLDALNSIKLTAMDRTIVTHIQKRVNKGYEAFSKENTRLGRPHAECSCVNLEQEDREFLSDILSAHCPDYCYFGALDSDGADYGVWPNDEVPLRGSGTDEIGKGPELPAAGTVSQGHWLVVTDHGNYTLWRKTRSGSKRWRWIQCWSMV